MLKVFLLLASLPFAAFPKVPQERKLMLDPPPVSENHHVIIPQSLPQVNAPRLFIKNFPKPSGSDIDFGTTQVLNEANKPTANINL